MMINLSPVGRSETDRGRSLRGVGETETVPLTLIMTISWLEESGGE